MRLLRPCQARILERWHVSPTFNDPLALSDVVVAREQEGIVAKRLTSTYRPGIAAGSRSSTVTGWRYGHEVEAIKRKVERRGAFV